MNHTALSAAHTIQYMKPKTGKKLQMLRDTLRISDITGDCGIAYFMNQWERLC